MKAIFEVNGEKMELEDLTIKDVVELRNAMAAPKVVAKAVVSAPKAVVKKAKRVSLPQHPWTEADTLTVIRSVQQMPAGTSNVPAVVARKLHVSMGRTESSVKNMAYRLNQYINGKYVGKHLSTPTKKVLRDNNVLPRSKAPAAPIAENHGFLGRVDVVEA